MKFTNEERVLFIKMFSDASEGVQESPKKSTLDILTEKELNLIVAILSSNREDLEEDSELRPQVAERISEINEICSVIRIHQYTQRL